MTQQREWRVWFSKIGIKRIIGNGEMKKQKQKDDLSWARMKSVVWNVSEIMTKN